MDIKVTDSLWIKVVDGQITLIGSDDGETVLDYDDIDTLKGKLDTAGLIAMEQRQSDPCPYTHSHTRNWCGHVGCRKS